MPHPRAKSRVRQAPILATAVASAGGFAALTTLVAKHRTRKLDHRVRRHFASDHSKPAKVTVEALGYSGKPWVHGPIASAIAAYVDHRGSLQGSRAINLASSLASTVSKSCDWLMQHRAPPAGRHKPKEQSYPSGHTLETAAVSLVSAYVLSREGMVDGRIALPIATALPILQGLGRMYLDRHWMTDVIAGMLGGVAIAAVVASGYEAKIRTAS
jgi:undecaprenyl-diphosphatase